LSRIEKKTVSVAVYREKFHSEISTGSFPQAKAIHDSYADKSASSAKVLVSYEGMFLSQNGALLRALV
jgi:hypothetical protein